MEEWKEKTGKYGKYVLFVGLAVVAVLLVVVAAQDRTSKPVENPGPTVKEVVVTKEVAVKVEKEVLVTVTPVPATATPTPTPVPPANFVNPALVKEKEGWWEDVCKEMTEYARDCGKHPECKESNDPRRCILYAEPLEAYIRHGQEIYLLEAHDWVKLWASQYAAQNGKDDSWVSKIVREVLTNPQALAGVELFEVWDSMEK